MSAFASLQPTYMLFPVYMHRRHFITASAAGVLTACASVPSAPSPHPTARVKVRRDRILKSVVGLRPHRDGGFRLERAPFVGKTLIHNYGHSGDGVSLSHGSARIAAEMAHAAPTRETAILGAGVMGLTTARLLAAWGHKVTIYAADMPPDTTSNIAGALILVPHDFNRRNPTRESVQQDKRVTDISNEVWDKFAGLKNYGVKRVETYRLRGAGSGAQVGPDDAFLGRAIRRTRSRVMVDPGIYLAALVRDLQSAGVTFRQAHFNSPADIEALPQKTIVNCTGLGAGQLFLDENVVPVRGQLTLLKPQPEIKYAYLAANPVSTLYMFPRETSIVLGGTRERGKTHLTVDEDTVERMLREHGEMASHLSGTNMA